MKHLEHAPATPASIKTFLISVFTALAFVCVIFSILLWRGFDHIERAEADLIEQQQSVVLIEKIRFHTSQVQQFLTDVSATHREGGFQDAAQHLQAARENLDELGKAKPSIQDQCHRLQEKLTIAHDNGVSMARDYIQFGIAKGNASMDQLDASSMELINELNDLARRMEDELTAAIAERQVIFYNNRLILMVSSPIILLVAGLFIGKISRIIQNTIDDLKYRTTQFNTILDTAPSAIISIDKTGIVHSFNRSAEKIFGYAASEILGRNVSCLMPLAMAKEHDNHLKRYIDGKQAGILGRSREVEGLRKNGESFPAMLRVNYMEIGEEMFFSGVIDDISDTKALQMQLGQAQKMEAIGQLAAGIAHEINTPIQFIGDNLSSLTDNFAHIIQFEQKLQELAHNDPERKAQLAQLIEDHDLAFILEDSPSAIKQAQEGINRVSEIVNAMKAFSHVDATQSIQTTDLHQALKNAIVISRNSYKYIAEIETHFDSDVSTIDCFANELNQVFLNLIINAAHSIEEKNQGMGRIKVSTVRLDQNWVDIQIADTGAGIPDVIREKVFNLFFTTKEVGKGSGQGLSLAHNIVVEKHKGKLYFESTVGVGTTFHIQLPIKPCVN